MEFVVPGPPVKVPADVPNGVAVYVPVPIPKLLLKGRYLPLAACNSIIFSSKSNMRLHLECA